MKKYIIIIIVTLFYSAITAQNKNEHKPKSYTDEQGKLYWNKALPVYLFVSSEPNGEKIQLKNPKQKETTNPFYLDSEGVNYIRSKWLVDPKTRKLVRPQQEVLFPIIADGVAPTVTPVFSKTPRYYNGKTTFYGKDLSLKFICKDRHSGVEALYVSINNSPFVKTTEPVTFSKEGENIIKYYSVDNVGNSSKIKEKKIILDLEPPETNYNISGINLNQNILSARSKISLYSEDKLSGVKKIMYRIDGKEFRLFNTKIISLYGLKDGNHKLEYYAVDKVNNKEQAKTFDFYLDTEAPITTYEALGDRFIVNGKIYFSGRTKLKIIAIDNKAGIKTTQYSIDNQDFKEYTKPFYLSNQPGEHIVNFYSLDKMDNMTKPMIGTANKYKNYKYNREKIYVDLTGPEISHSFSGKIFKSQDTIYCGKDTKIHLVGKDLESGLQYLAYSIDGEKKEHRYTEPITIQKSGRHVIEYFGYDNVNNRNIGSLTVCADLTPPQASVHYSTPPIKTVNGIDVYPSFTNVYLSAVDKKTGVNKIMYNLNNTNFKIYSKPIRPIKTGENILKLKAYDYLKNMEELEVKFFIEK